MSIWLFLNISYLDLDQKSMLIFKLNIIINAVIMHLLLLDTYTVATSYVFDSDMYQTVIWMVSQGYV